MGPLLTIAIPTYNRSVYLDRLLAVLDEMTRDVGGRIELLISDNASTDRTSEVIAAFAQHRPDARTIRNSANIGADANIEQCFRLASGEFVWIMGDDDMPKASAVDAVLRALSALQPDLMYLPSEWLPEVTNPEQGTAFDAQRYRATGQLEFSRRVNVWLTFLSGIIVRKASAADADLSIMHDTNLVQLGWILAALKNGERFCIFDDSLVLATGGNTGGYAVVNVFGVNLSVAVARIFGRTSAIYRAIVGRTVTAYLPQLIWNIRTGAGGRFTVDLPWADMRRQVGGFPAFWAFVVPIGRAPLPVARGFLLAARAAAKIGRLLER